MNTIITVKQLIKWVMEQFNGYQPLPQSICTLLNKHGLNTTVKYFNNKPVKFYNANNAKRTITQHFDELQYWDEEIYINQLKKQLKKENMTQNKFKNIIKETIDNFINQQTISNNKLSHIIEYNLDNSI